MIVPKLREDLMSSPIGSNPQATSICKQINAQEKVHRDNVNATIPLTVRVVSYFGAIRDTWFKKT